MLKIFAVAVALSLSSCPGAIGKALRLWGYTEVQPAADYWEPGSLVTVEKWQPFRVRVLCPAAKMLGDDYKPHESLTMTADMSRIRKKGVTLEVDVADIVNSNNTINGVSDLKMTLDNAHIFEVTDYDIYSRRNRTDPACLEALRDRLADGHKVTLISSALRADVVYTVSWDRQASLSVAAKVEALANLSGKLGAEARPQTTNKISGKGLYWGIRDDMWLAQQFLKPGTAPAVEPGTRLIPTSLIIRHGKGSGPTDETTPASGEGSTPMAPAPGSSTDAPPADPNQVRTGPATAHSNPDSAHSRGKRVFSIDTEEGPMQYELDEEPEAEDFALVPADPNDRVGDLLLDAAHEED